MIDIAKKQVTDTIAWPNGEREGVQIIFSPSGDLITFTRRDAYTRTPAHSLGRGNLLGKQERPTPEIPRQGRPTRLHGPPRQWKSNFVV